MDVREVGGALPAAIEEEVEEALIDVQDAAVQQPVFTCECKVDTSGGEQLDVVYTNDSKKLNEELAIYLGLLWKHRRAGRFMGLDLKYTADEQKIAVIQLCLDTRVLVFHYCRREDKLCRALRDFLENQNITFASVDTRGDKIRLDRARIDIPSEYHVDLQDLLKYQLGNKRDGMASLATKIISRSYESMKKGFPLERHKHWEDMPLHNINIDYAAIDAFVSYDIYRRREVVNEGQRRLLAPVPCPNCQKGKKPKMEETPDTGDQESAGWAEAYRQYKSEQVWEKDRRSRELAWNNIGNTNTGWY